MKVQALNEGSVLRHSSYSLSDLSFLDPVVSRKPRFLLDHRKRSLSDLTAKQKVPVCKLSAQYNTCGRMFIRRQAVDLSNMEKLWQSLTPYLE